MQKYVLMFAFDLMRNQVLLIEKKKPKWQKYRWNGVGGKIEIGESNEEAVVREFKEGTGMTTIINQWRFIGIMQGEDWEVHCYTATLPIEEAQTMGIEQVKAWPITDLHYIPLLSNLQWLVHFAFDGKPKLFNIKY